MSSLPSSEKRRRKFITSALPYVNNQPHLGNIVGSVLSADVYSRFSKKMGYDTVFISGTDEFGTAIEMEAIKEGVHPKEIVEKNRKLHKRVYDWFNIDFDYFGHTFSERHIQITQQIFMECCNNGYFTEEEVEQYFCDQCQQFLADRYVEGVCKLCGYIGARGDQCDGCGKCLHSSDIDNPYCVICKAKPVLKVDKHLHLRLDLLQEKVREKFEEKHVKWTNNAQGIYKSWMSREIRSRSMTRTLRHSWGVPVPLENHNEKVFYVWFDAPIGYFSFLSDYFSASRPDKDWVAWAKDSEFVQFMGKDNVPFHSLIFPSIILAASSSKYPIVDIINSTEYLMFYGDKFSKSRRVGIFGMDLLENDLGCPDFWRFFLIKERPERKDADFVIEKFIQQVNGDLISNWGNFCNRTLKYIQKNLKGNIEIGSDDPQVQKVTEDFNKLFAEYKSLIEQRLLREALDKALEASSYGNSFLQGLQGTDISGRNKGFSIAFSLVVFLAHMFEPFTPSSSQKALSMCCVSDKTFPESFSVYKRATISDNIDVLFSKWSTEQVECLKKYIPEGRGSTVIK